MMIPFSSSDMPVIVLVLVLVLVLVPFLPPFFLRSITFGPLIADIECNHVLHLRPIKQLIVNSFYHLVCRMQSKAVRMWIDRRLKDDAPVLFGHRCLNTLNTLYCSVILSTPEWSSCFSIAVRLVKTRNSHLGAV